jgi:hypothetical protein
MLTFLPVQQTKTTYSIKAQHRYSQNLPALIIFLITSTCLMPLSAATDLHKFPVNQRYGYFPAFSAGWRISQESFLKDVNMAYRSEIAGRLGHYG